MKIYTFTEAELETFVELTQGLNDYQGSYESVPDYQEWLEQQFGEDCLDYSEPSNLYQYEFDTDWWYGYTTGRFSSEILTWIENTRHDIQQLTTQE